MRHALDGWIDVCRTGTWTDVRGRETEVTPALLDAVVADYATADPAPVVVGHPETDAPAYGWVERLRVSGDRLQAKLSDLAPEFRAAVEAGRYGPRSIALQGDRLRHVGFLGGRAPAVPGLTPTRFASPADRVIVLAEADLASPSEAWGWRTVARVLRRVREWIVERDGVERADAVIPEHEIEAISDAPADDDASPFASPGGAGANTNTTKEAEMARDTETTGGATPDGVAALAAAREQLAAERAELAAERAAADAARRVTDADAALEGHVRAGRVLPAERASLAALLASLPGETEIRLAGPDGKETAEAPAAVLERFLAALPARVPYGEFAADDGAAEVGEVTDRRVVALATKLMDDEGLNSIQATDRARDELGLTKRAAA